MGYLNLYEGAECDGCFKKMSVEEAHRADYASEFIWLCDDCRGYSGVYDCESTEGEPDEFTKATSQ